MSGRKPLLWWRKSVYAVPTSLPSVDTGEVERNSVTEGAPWAIGSRSVQYFFFAERGFPPSIIEIY